MANIPVNAAQWNAVSREDQEKIIAAFKESKLIGSDDTIVPDPNAEALDEDSPIIMAWNPIGDLKKSLCKKLCDALAATAFAWCAANTAGVGYIGCMAAAEALRKACKKKC